MYHIACKHIGLLLTLDSTLGLLRPSSQATKEKQEAERQQREGSSGRHQPDRQQDKPKIVWFKPTDKRVPLIAIPTEQAPRDFVERHQDYANRIFVACIKRWPITSLHPFGTLVEQLGEMGDLKVETDALLRDNNFGPDDFSDAVLKNVGFDEWSVANESEEALAARRDFRGETTFTIDPNGTQELDDAIHVKELGNGQVEIGIHVADVAHFIKANSLVDREAKKRGTGVYLMDRAVNMLPPRLSADICSLSPGEDRFTVSVVFKVDSASGRVLDDEPWIGKALIKSSGKLTYDEVDAVIHGNSDVKLEGATVEDIQLLNVSLAARPSIVHHSFRLLIAIRGLRKSSASPDSALAQRTFLLSACCTSSTTRMYRSSKTYSTLHRLMNSLKSSVTKQTRSLLGRLQKLCRRRLSSAVRLLLTQEDYRRSRIG